MNISMQCITATSVSAAIALGLMAMACSTTAGPDGAPSAAGPPPIERVEDNRLSCELTGTQMVIPLGDAEMVPICDDTYAEPGLTPPEISELRSAYTAAREDLARAFGQATRSSPLTLFCRTAGCKVAFGAPPANAEAQDLGFARDLVPTRDGLLEHSIVVVTGPVPGSARILTHELVHAEMKAWTPYDSLPTWFNEGMATFVADEPNCDMHPPASEPRVELLTTKEEWERHLRDHRDALETYCQSRHRVAAWAARFASDEARAAALKRLMLSVANGSTFEVAVSLGE